MIQRIEQHEGGYTFGMTLIQHEGDKIVDFGIQARGSHDEEAAQCDRKQLLRETSFTSIRFMLQVHGADYAWVEDDSAYDTQIENVDALLCASPNILLCAQVADCAGIVLYHPHRKLFAVVHSGWRGTAQNIVGVVIRELCRRGSCDGSALHAWCTPCATAPEYVVRSDVQSRFPQYCQSVDENHYAFDHRSALRDQLMSSGLNAQHITMSMECTMTDARMHSFRRDGASAGRMVVFVGTK